MPGGPVLVVGATGQLGTAVVRRLAGRGARVRAFARRASAHGHLGGAGIELAFGDLRDPASLDAACHGAETVVATANAVVPGGGGGFAEAEDAGYRNLIEACRRHGVRRFVFMSVPATARDAGVPTFALKRRIERALASSGLETAIFRGSLFMDDWFALMGSSIPLRGAEAHTLRRPFWFSRAFLGMVGHSIEKRGVALVPGDGRARHAFIATDDVADYLAAAATAPAAAGTFDIGGPEVLTWDDVVALFARVLSRRVRAIHTPAAVYRGLALALAPVSEAASNLMALSWLVALEETPWDSRDLARRFSVTPTSAEAFLRRRLALPE
jgi:NADH dehydrogenase